MHDPDPLSAARRMAEWNAQAPTEPGWYYSLDPGPHGIVALEFRRAPNGTLRTWTGCGYGVSAEGLAAKGYPFSPRLPDPPEPACAEAEKAPA